MGRRIADISEQEKADICRLYAAGNKIADIAATYAMSGGMVCDIANLGGIPPRQRRAARALELATFDLAKLDIEAVDGEPRCVDVRLGAALGYERPRAVRQLIERLSGNLLELGPLPQRVAMVDIGSGATRETIEYLLSLAQVNYLITRCGLPRADEWCVHIARVFTAWQEGKLESGNLKTAVDLQDSAETSVAVPQIPALTEAMLQAAMDRSWQPYGAKIDNVVAQVTEVRTQVTEVQESVIYLGIRIDDIVPRRDFINWIRGQYNTTSARNYFYGCPACPANSRTRIVCEDGSSIQGELNYDHFRGRELNGVEDGWPVCKRCNLRLKTDVTFKTSMRPHFEVFHAVRRSIFGDATSAPNLAYQRPYAGMKAGPKNPGRDDRQIPLLDMTIGSRK